MMSAAAKLRPDLLEAVARVIHEGYRANQADRKPAGDPAMAEWDVLPEHLRASNRAQAGDLFEKLREIDCTVHEGGDEVEVIAFSADEIERMAVMEHDRWVAERLAGGWTSGERDVVAKKTPYLVTWEQLPEEAREWDREAVRMIPELLAGVGLEIRRRQQPR